MSKMIKIYIAIPAPEKNETIPQLFVSQFLIQHIPVVIEANTSKGIN